MPPKKKSQQSSSPGGITSAARCSAVTSTAPEGQQLSASICQVAPATTAASKIPMETAAAFMEAQTDDAAAVLGPIALATATSLDDYVTVVVTPKLSFQLPRRPEWKTVQDITQDELRRGFLSRFPPALWLSSNKFSFMPALSPNALITEDTKSLVYKLVSDEVPDERVMLGILREVERSYEAMVRRAVSDTRSEALVEQEQAESFRREQEKRTAELKKENKSLRDQLQSIQKRLFLVEQEKDQLRKEQQQMKDLVTRLDNQQMEQAQENRTLRSEMETQQVQLRQDVEAMIQQALLCQEPCRCSREREGDHQEESQFLQTAEVDGAHGKPGPATLSQTIVVDEDTPPCGVNAISTASIRTPSSDIVEAMDVECQTDVAESAANGPAVMPPGREDSVSMELRLQVERLQLQIGSLQGWLLQGSRLLAPFNADQPQSQLQPQQFPQQAMLRGAPAAWGPVVPQPMVVAWPQGFVQNTSFDACAGSAPSYSNPTS